MRATKNQFRAAVAAADKAAKDKAVAKKGDEGDRSDEFKDAAVVAAAVKALAKAVAKDAFLKHKADHGGDYTRVKRC